jgi:hypothetical protein
VSVRLGISILDLLPQTTGLALQIPDDIVEKIGILTVLDHRATTSSDFFLHEGTLQSVNDALDIDTTSWPLRIPGLTHGLPFRMAVQRVAPGGGGQEGTPALWTLDIEVRDVEVELPGVVAARTVGGTGITPLTLEPIQGTNAQRRVYLVARGVVRVSGGGPGGTQVQIVDTPDPFDPTAPTGAVIRLTAKPPHFLFGGSRYGMTLDQFVLDLSRTYTPPEIVAREHDEAWEGVAFRETTFYLPPDTPLFHSLSVSARDVVLGDPGGLQGELRVEFGEDVADVYNTRIAVKLQQAGGSETDISMSLNAGTSLQFATPAGPNGAPQRVRAVFQIGAGELIAGHTDLAAVGVWWKLPDGREGNDAATPWFDAPTTNVLHYRLRLGAPSTASNTASSPSAVPTDQTELVEVLVSFPRQSGSPTGIGPIVDATIDGTTFNNVIHLRGPRARIAGTQLAIRGGGHGTWQLGTGSAPTTARDTASFTVPPLAQGTATRDLTVADDNGTRRIRIEVVPQGPLAVGHQTTSAPNAPGVVTVVGAGGGDATPTDVIDTFNATPFHQRAERVTASGVATIAGNQITVPQGADTEVEVPIPGGANDPLPVVTPPTNDTPTVVQVLYNWDESVPQRVIYPYDGPADAQAAAHHEADALPLATGDLMTRRTPGGTGVDSALRQWIADLGPANGRKFYIVGRTDDLALGATEAENNTYNDGLALRRANAAKDALTAALAASGGDASTIQPVAAERTGLGSTPEGSPPARFIGGRRLALPPAHVTKPAGANSPVWNGLWNPDSSNLNSSTHQLAKNDPNRPPYRCAEIYVVDTGAPASPPPPPPSGAGVPTRMLVPGADGPPPPGLPTTTSSAPPTDYRVRLRVKWDSPTVVQLSDAIPTEAEALIAWKKAQVELPASNSGTAPPIPPPTGPDYWEVLLRWAYDSRTGETEASGALSLPDGTLTWQSDALSGALAFGPAITALADPADAITDPVGQFVAASAIIAVGAAIGELINTGGGPESSVDIDKFAISYKWDGAPHAAATLDYTIDLRVNVSVAGSSLVGHLRLRYKGVGLRFDGAPAGGLAGIALTYDSMSVEVVDPGTWSLGGPLGNLIRIAASRMGNGSQWMEFDLEFALDLGVVRLEGATIRLGLEPFSVEFRGLTASVDIPATLKGKGSVTIGDGGSFRALLALEVIPAKLSAYGALAVDQDFVAVEVGVQLPVGIPLGGTGFGIFGFMGRFVANGTRNLEGLTNPDPVQKQLDWYVRSPQDKYARKSGQFAFGVGAVIGTLPDGGFTFNAEGSLSIGFPDVSVVFGIDAHLITQRKSQATESGTNNASSFRILGMVLIEETSIMVAVRASYEIPKVLKLEIPISAYFPLAGGDAWYIRIGTDNDATRPGSPVTVTLLPDLLDVRAWAFVMIEERQLHHLGGTLVPLDLAQPLDFDGFSIGTGAGFDLKWSAGPFKLEISAFLLVGVGTKPLLFAGAAGIKGELDLVIISVGVDGLIHFHISPGYSFVEGHFCGHVDFFFFTVSGCVDIRIGDDPPSDIPAPDSPIAGMDLCDHLAAVKGKGARVDADVVPTVWPDTVAVLRFAHYIEDALGAAADFDRKLPSPAALSPWSGTTELKYAFRLNAVELWKLTGNNPGNAADWTQVHGPFDAAWWMPTHRAGIIEGGGAPGPSTEEGRELGLFSTDPRAWSRWLGEGTQNVPGDPANTVGQVCDPAEPADPSCAFGRDRFFAPDTLGAFKATPDANVAIPSRFTVFATLGGGLDAATAASLGADAGWNWLPGVVAPLHGPASVHGTTLTQGWRFPEWRTLGHIVGTAPITLGLSKPLLQGELVLEICGERKDTTPPDKRVCDAMPSQDGTVNAFAGSSGAKYEGQAMRCVAIGGQRALVLTQGSMHGVYPGAAASVSVDLDPRDGKTELIALSSTGAAIGHAVTAGAGRQSITVAGEGIGQITIRGNNQPTIFEVCWGTAPTPAILQVVNLEATPNPRVVAYDIDGKPTPLTGTLLTGGVLEAALIAIPRCPKYVFPLPKGKGWTRIEVAPWVNGDVSLVALCGVTLEAAAAQAADNDYRSALTGLLLELAQDAVTDTPTHDVYLDADTTYEIRVGWQWQGVRPTNGAEPAPPAAADWNDGGVEHFRFHTAAFQLAAAPAPVEDTSLDVDPAQGGPGYDERSFDPRGIARYLTRAAPSHEDPPHFLDDHVGFWFMVDHLEKLVEKYDRILQVKVLHTRPEAGSLHNAPLHVPGAHHLLDVTTGVSWNIDTLAWTPADFRLVEAAIAAPCVGVPPALGSSSVSVTADLEPHSEYDLLLNTAPKTVGAFPEVQVARSHFRTSRYHNPTELLRALGFELPLAVAMPTDAIASAPLAAGALEMGDTQLDAALTTLGLDPWPIPAAPRTSVIWLRPASAGQPWRIAAVLVEADEPVWRAGFKTGAYGETEPPPRLEVSSMMVSRTYEHTVFHPFPHGKFGWGGGLTTVTSHAALGTLTERVRNAAGTRSIFVPAAPIAMTGGRLYDIAIQFNENGSAGAHGSAPVLDRPLMIAEEGAA